MKLIKTLFKIIFALIIILIISVGVCVYLVYDTTGIDNKYNDYNGPISYEINSIVSKSLVNTASSSVIDMSLDEENLNYLLASLINPINDSLPANIKITSSYIDIINNESMKICIYAKAYFFKTSIKGDFSFKKENDEIILSINKASVGKINASNKTIGNILKLSITEDSVVSNLKNKGINISFSLNDLKFTIQMSELEKILNKQFEQDQNKELYNSLFDILFENNLVNIVNSDNKLGVSLNLEQLSYNSSFCEIPYSYDYNSIKTKTESLLNSKIISYEQTGLVFDYLVRGYDKIKENEDSKFIKDLDLSSIGISNNLNYKGILFYSQKSMLDIIVEQTPSLADLLSPTFDFKIYSSDLDNLLFKTGIVGVSYAFARKKDNLYQISYLYLESIYTSIIDDTLYLIISLNINGKQIALKCDLETESSNGLCIKTNVTNINFGSISLSDNQIKSILSYLSNVTAEESWFEVDNQNNKINFNFTNLFEDNLFLSTFLTYTSSTNCKLVNNSDDGYIKISFGINL